MTESFFYDEDSIIHIYYIIIIHGLLCVSVSTILLDLTVFPL